MFTLLFSVCVPAYIIFCFSKHNLKYIYVCLEFTKIIESVWQIKWKTKKYHIVGRFPKYNRKIVGRVKMDTVIIHIHERSLSLGICISIKSGGVKLVLKA
jgi:hypothetical protein